MQHKKKKISTVFPLAFITIASGIVCFKVSTGSIGNGETWRLIASSLGFVVFLSFFTGMLMHFFSQQST